MNTKHVTMTMEDLRSPQMQEACEILQQGGLVAFPTETVYGLGGDALNPDSSRKIYGAKGRPSDNPLIVHIADMESLPRVASHISEKAMTLARTFWPGPMTLIFDKQPEVPLETTGGLETVAVRMPSHPIAQELIRQSGVYVAAPSANASGRPSPTRASHVAEDLDGRIDMIIDGDSLKDTSIGLESTIVDMTVEPPMILRPGYITREMLEGAVGTVEVDPAIENRTRTGNRVAKAPGMKYRHYAPKGQMTIVEGPQEKVVDTINDLVREKKALGCKVAVIATSETAGLYQCELVRCAGSRQVKGSIAAGLYDILREMDHLGAEFIFAESFQDDALGTAIMNRMIKAAGYHLIQV